MSGWTTGVWVMFLVNLLGVCAGLYLFLFGGRIEARQRAKREAEGMDDEAGYQSPLSAANPRIQGLIILTLSGFFTYRYLLAH
jgi:hypothetical protein